MTVTTTILKEKNVEIHQFIPAPKMQVKMNRINVMPDNPADNTIQCEIKLTVNILDEEKKDLASVHLNYIVIAMLEQNDKYIKEDCANRLFNVLQPMYVSEVNNLLRESPFPPIPLNVNC